MYAQSLSCVWLFAALWAVVHQALCPWLSRQEHWSRLPFPTPGDLPNPGIKPASLASPALAGGFFTTVPPGKPQENHLPRLITEQDLMGPSIISSALAPLWRPWIAVSDACFLSCFIDAKTPTKEKMLTAWWSWAQPQASSGLMMWTLATPPCSLRYPVAHLPHLAFENALPKPFGELRAF